MYGMVLKLGWSGIAPHTFEIHQNFFLFCRLARPTFAAAFVCCNIHPTRLLTALPAC